MSRPSVNMDLAREAEVRRREREVIVPEANHTRPIVAFEISRYDKGPCMGLFTIHQVITEQNGKKLKQPIRKTVSDGDDFFMASVRMAEALRKKVFG
jgi:hypothetical protein